MTDRTQKLTVILDKPIRTDDAEAVVAAIGCLRGVACVQVHPLGPEDDFAMGRARIELRQQIADLLWPKEKP